jgi:sugar phosphate isomerase/epimerase
VPVNTGSPLAFSTLAFPDASLAQALSLGRSCGYDAVELRLIDGALIDPLMPAAARRTVKHAVESAGLPVVAVDSSIKLTEPGPEAARELAAFLELASDWEAPLVRVFGGPLPASERSRDRAAALAQAGRVLAGAVGRAEQLGVRIGVETHDSFAASAVVAELLAVAESPWLGAVWDSHHPHRVGERPAQVYRNLGSRLLLAQVKDARRAPERADGWQLVLLGAGEVPVEEMIALLIAHGYTGPISVEWEKRWHPEIEPAEIALPQHLALLRGWLHCTDSASSGPE